MNWIADDSGLAIALSREERTPQFHYPGRIIRRQAAHEIEQVAAILTPRHDADRIAAIVAMTPVTGQYIFDVGVPAGRRQPKFGHHILEQIGGRVEPADFLEHACVEHGAAEVKRRFAAEPGLVQLRQGEPTGVIPVLRKLMTLAVDQPRAGSDQPDVGAPLCGSHAGFDKRRVDQVVVVQQQKIGPPGLLEAEIEIVVGIEIHRLVKIADAGVADRSDIGFRLVGRAVVGDDDFQRFVALRQGALKGLPQIALGAVVGGNPDGNKYVRHAMRPVAGWGGCPGDV